MAINRDQFARRIALKGGYKIKDIEQILKLADEVALEIIKEGHDLKVGKNFKIYTEVLPEKRAYDGLNDRYFIRERKRVPKIELLSQWNTLKLPLELDEENEES
ncbi:hypothetical protein LD13_gp122 [Bacillus phage Bobb]|uniref:DNA-binding protein n=1 Tax=Bacillus phage Bobb TaxID=1527469 RepID=A0A076G8V2_9CAUD|nr:hypothetical protein LD13_gp122 [Bacillus phage Bobb]AII28023.1 hypothetical protein [Bacillus phage Bobb]